MMLRSTVFVVQPTIEATLPKTTGRVIWACALGLIGGHDPEMAAALHDGKGLKPVAASPLQGPFTVAGDRLRLRSEQTYWFRISSVDAALSRLLETIETQPPRVLELDRQRFEVVTVSSDPRQHDWAQRQSYDDLYAAAWQEAGGASPLLALAFVSPTVFLSQGRTVLWPEPHRVFGSLLQRWQSYAPTLLPEDLETAFASHVEIDAYELRTRVQRYTRDASRQVWYQKGFVGTCHYRAQRGTPEAVLRVLHLLARYALFAGVGSRTTVGMGQARQVDERRRSGGGTCPGGHSGARQNSATRH